MIITSLPLLPLVIPHPQIIRCEEQNIPTSIFYNLTAISQLFSGLKSEENYELLCSQIKQLSIFSIKKPKLEIGNVHRFLLPRVTFPTTTNSIPITPLKISLTSTYPIEAKEYIAEQSVLFQKLEENIGDLSQTDFTSFQNDYLLLTASEALVTLLQKCIRPSSEKAKASPQRLFEDYIVKSLDYNERAPLFDEADFDINTWLYNSSIIQYQEEGLEKISKLNKLNNACLLKKSKQAPQIISLPPRFNSISMWNNIQSGHITTPLGSNGEREDKLAETLLSRRNGDVSDALPDIDEIMANLPNFEQWIETS